MRDGWRELRKGLYRRDSDAAVVRQDGRGWFARDARGLYLMPAGHEPVASIAESDDEKRRFRSADDAMAALDGEEVEEYAPTPRASVMSVTQREHVKLAQWSGQVRRQKWNLEGELASGRPVVATADRPARFEAAKAMVFEGLVQVIREGPRRVTKGPPGPDGKRRLREEIVIAKRVKPAAEDEI